MNTAIGTTCLSPRIRFKEFGGAWEARPLGEAFDERNERSGIGRLLSVTIGEGVIPASENGKRDNSNTDKSNYKCVKTGDLAYNSMRMWQGACGASAFDGIVSPAYTVLIPKAEIDSPFAERLFKLKKILKVFQAYSQGLTSDTWNLKYPALSEIELAFPSLPEQWRIAELFRNLDETIAATDARLEKLRQSKKSLLEKMFPRPGASVPEIRFKGFEGKWKTCKAHTIFETTDERNHPELPVLSANQERGMIFRNDGGMNISHDKANEVTYKRVRPGQFVIHLRSFQGGFAHSAVDGLASPAYTVFRFKNEDEHCDLFWRYVLTSEQFIRSLVKITYGIRDGRSISFDEFSEESVCFPDKAEQQRIGAFFCEFDKLIESVQKKAAKLRQVKSALLEEMFV